MSDLVVVDSKAITNVIDRCMQEYFALMAVFGTQYTTRAMMERDSAQPQFANGFFG
jgi:hypothetical protein